MDLHNVRSLIPYLNFGRLRKLKLIPDIVKFTRLGKGGAFASLVNKIGYSEYGLLMERVIEECIESTGSIKSIKKNVDTFLESYQLKDFPIEEIVYIYTMVKQKFEPKTGQYQLEWHSHDGNNIVGHPDLVYRNTVYDIKTSGRFNAMRTESILQILSYYSLAKLNDHKVNSVGLILPAQRKIISYYIGDWDWVPFWSELVGCITFKLNRENLYQIPLSEYIPFKNKLLQVGTTINKSNLLTSLYRNSAIPYQFFIKGNRSSDVTLDNMFKQKLSEHIQKGARVYIHSSYSFNLCNPDGRFKLNTDKEGFPWVCDKLSQLMKMGAQIGIKGVVVHCGKTGPLPKHDPEYTINQKINTMRDSIEIICKYVKPECPLLIETSSGENGETLTSSVELIKFYYSLSSESQKKVKICVDTCHVFASGSDPDLYLNTLIQKQVPIGLIHYNDSKMPKGSKIDRHASIGKGYIGFNIMNKVLKLALNRAIDCVYE